MCHAGPSPQHLLTHTPVLFCSAACSVGAAQACFELARDHVQVRKAFGAPLSANQVPSLSHSLFSPSPSRSIHVAAGLGRLRSWPEITDYPVQAGRHGHVDHRFAADDSPRCPQDRLWGNYIIMIYY